MGTVTGGPGKETGMGYVRARIEIANVKDPTNKALTVTSLVDTGALLLCIPEGVAVQLGLDELDRRAVRMADGTLRTVPYMGPILIGFENRRCLAGALVMGDEVLLGAVPMEEMDVLISPKTRTLVVNPAHPDGPVIRV